MKTSNKNEKLNFSKYAIAELNPNEMKSVNGGSTSPLGPSIIVVLTQMDLPQSDNK
ncbi:class I lanthipeptide [Aquimarina sp. U1-2]|uniref:class I lanthipeptide n=1 Tax=Aquimarina sp. U1-2 TaxID=2823141 RepID=UPI001AECD7C1|nr:class I lanthipeptide [Aquimarina sp. U1-2]MBP2833391.1 class I lanthipeptide [Aquimarina sp. U1-2]